MLLQQVKVFIQQLSNPFGFLQYRVNEIDKAIHLSEQNEMDEEQTGDHRYHEKEKNLEKVFDNYALKVHAIVAPSLKQDQVSHADHIHWDKALLGCLWTYLLLTVIASLARPDFMSLTAISLAFLVLHFPTQHGRRTFRMITVFLVITFVYDLLWLFILRSSEAEDAEMAGRGQLIRWFAHLNAWLSFFFRIVVIAIFWKVSLHYTQVVKRQAGVVESNDQALDRIMNRYSNLEGNR